MNYILFENYKKLLLIMLLSVFLAACVLPFIHFLNEYLIQSKSEYLIMFSVQFIFAIFILRTLIIVLKNFKKIFYFKIYQEKFEYLSIPMQTNTSRGAIIERLKSIYLKPEYKTKSFYDIKRFKPKKNGQIEIIYNDGLKITLPIYLSLKKLEESISKLNTKLVEFEKLN